MQPWSAAIRHIFIPEKDFTVQPWIARSLKRELGYMDVAVGCKVEAGIGEIIRIYEQRCKVVARLEPTGTGLDTAVYCNMNTMNALLSAAEEKGVSHRIESGDSVVSAVYTTISTIPIIKNFISFNFILIS